MLKKFCFDIVALSETWLDESVDNASFFGELATQYAVFRCDRKVERGGGVALLVKLMLSSSLAFSEAISNAYEILCCDLSMKCETTRVLIVYKAPTCPAKMAKQLFKAPRKITSGAHQGGVLPPILFNIYTHELPAFCFSIAQIEKSRTFGGVRQVS
ncbi:hypothetical protein ANCDUO_06103 [Ancylostoma duodenale]|uniref:Reverse transcriptase domain-containing protein n=1 Tax=Ancylostoma duodenale TaxID=51022 RepID=A0A0C2DLU6_9BILA|nr:hypothetical protein ANCDUO_06103 [Ancylostoma duodenale]